MPVIINNQRLVPSPLVTMSKSYNITDGGVIVGASYLFNLQGNLLPNQGNPIVGTSGTTSSFSNASWTSTYDPGDDPLHGVNVEDRLISLMTKQEQVRDLFSPGTGVKVEILGWNHSQGLRFVGNVAGEITFNSDGRWVNPLSYSVDISTNNFITSAQTGVFSGDSSEDNFSYYVSEIDESWAVQEAEDYTIGTGDFSSMCRSYSVTHDLSAKGKTVYNSSGTYLGQLQPWQQASGYVRGVLGLGGSNIPSGIITIPPGFYLANRKLTENISRVNGTYGVNEQFTYYNSGIVAGGMLATEDVSLTIDSSEDAITNVNLQGTINGLDTTDPTSIGRTGVSKYTNALNYFNYIDSGLYNRALANSSLTWLHPRPKSKSVAKNPLQGQISYNYTYDNRPPNLIPGSVSEEITISDDFPSQLVAITPVIGRAQPILQYLNSSSEFRRNLNINVNMGGITGVFTGVNSSGYWSNANASAIRNWLIGQKPSLTQNIAFSSIFEAANPANEVGVIPTKVFYQNPTESWNPKTGSYNYSVSWIFERST